jgi:hypothetical protein
MEYEKVFVINSGEYRLTERMHHCIDDGEARPIQQPARRIPLSKPEELDVMLKYKQRHELVRESNSPWSGEPLFSRCLQVPKLRYKEELTPNA